MTPDERDAFIKSLRAPAPAATPAPAKPNAKPAAKPAVAPVAPAKPLGTGPGGAPTKAERERAVAGILGVSSDVIEQERQETALRNSLIYDVKTKNMMLTDEAVNQEVDRQINELKAPINVAGYNVTRPFSSAVAPFQVAKQPVNLPPVAPVTFTDVLRPKIRVPESEVERSAYPFDDAGFEAGIKDLSLAEQKSERLYFEAYKRTFNKIRQLNPGISNDEIKADVQRQIDAIPSVMAGKGKNITQNLRAERTIAPDPLIIALSRQTKDGSVPDLEPGQLEFIKATSAQDVAAAQAADRLALLKPGQKPILRLVTRPSGDTTSGDKPVMEQVEEPTGKFTNYTPAEVDAIIKEKESRGEYDVRPWWQNADEKEKVLKNPEKYTTGGAFFEKKYPTGAVVESPTSWFVRSALIPWNTIAGTAGYFFTLDDKVQSAKEKGREKEFQAPGLYTNVLANVSEGGGYTKEVGDLYKYSPDPEIRRYETVGRIAGFAGDLFGLLDIGLVRGGMTGASSAAQFGRASMAAGEGAGAATFAATKAGARGAFGGWLDALPGMSRLSGKALPGDVRLIYGSKLADEFSAAETYSKKFAAETAPVQAQANPTDAQRAIKKVMDSPQFESVSQKQRNGEFWPQKGTLVNEIDKVDSDILKSLVEKTFPPGSLIRRPVAYKGVQPIYGDVVVLDSSDSQKISLLVSDGNGSKVIETNVGKLINEGSVRESFETHPRGAPIPSEFPLTAYEKTIEDFVSEIDDIIRIADEAHLPPPVEPGKVASVAHEIAVDEARAKYPKTKFVEDAESSPRIAEFIDNDYFTAGQKSFKEYSDVAKIVDKLESGIGITTAEERLIKPYLSAGANADKAIQVSIRKAFSLAEPGERISAETVFNTLDQTSKKAYADSIKAASAFDNGVVTIDTALSKMGSKGAKVIVVTPRTFATPDGAEKLAAEYRKTKFFTEVLDPVQKLPRSDVTSGKLVVQGYDLTKLPARAKTLIGGYAVATARESEMAGLISRVESERIITEIGKGTISAGDLQLLSHAALDNIASSTRGGITSRALAKVQEPLARTVPQEVVRTNVAKARRAAELKSDTPLIFSRAKNAIMDKLKPLDAIITTDQRIIITESASKISVLDKVFRDEFKRITMEPEFAKLYGVTTDATAEEKIIALGQGPAAAADQRLYAEELVKSLIYGTEQTPLYNAISPAYRYGETLLESSEDYNKLVAEIAQMNPAVLSSELDNVFVKVQQIIENNINPMIEAAGGRIRAVPRELAAETLIVAYARTKSADIMAEAVIKLGTERPVALSMTSNFLLKLKKETQGGERLYYDFVKKAIKDPEFFSYANMRAVDQQVGGIIVTPPFQVYLREACERIIGESPSAKVQINTQAAATAPIRSILPKTELLYNYLKQMFKADATIADDILASADLLKDSRMINSGKMEQSFAQINLLMSNKISPEQFVSPALAQKLISELGDAPKFQAMLTELARLSDLAHAGDKVALRTSNFIRGIWDSYNAFYYYNILSLNPRFHGVNNLTAPLIAYYTTGRAINPGKFVESAQIMLLGKPGGVRAESRLVPVVTDRLGNIYTRGQLYDLSVKSGIFKSQINTEVTRDFIADCNATVGRMSAVENKYLSGANTVRKKFTTLPNEILGDPLAAFTDNIWRMNSIRNALENGSTIDEALQFGRRSLFDYGDLTAAERVISRNFFVFYNYYRQSIVQFVKNFAQNPGRMVKLMRLAKSTSDIRIGDQKARDLSFFYPPEFGTGRAVWSMTAAARAKEGEAILLPQMPYNDGLNLFSLLLSDPVGAMIGPKMVGEGDRRDFQKGALTQKAGVGTMAAGQAIFSNVKVEQLLEIKLPKNRIPPEHVAFMNSLFLGTAYLDWFGAKVEDAAPGENNYGGKVFVLTDENFDDYKTWIIKLQAVGAARPLTDWGKAVGGLPGMDDKVLSGTYADTTGNKILSSIGAITVQGAGIPELQMRKGLTKQTQEMREVEEEAKKARLPKKEKDL